jgi:hypothetical protein
MIMDCREITFTHHAVQRMFKQPFRLRMCELLSLVQKSGLCVEQVLEVPLNMVFLHAPTQIRLGMTRKMQGSEGVVEDRE